LSTPLKPVEVFFSYAHKDEELMNELREHLAELERRGMIKSWHDREIPPGGEWDGEILRYLERADIILLLVSSSFLASAYINMKELTRALERHERGEVRVIPVILRSCLWEDAPFAKFQALPSNGKPISSWEDRDLAFTEVARGVREAAGNIPRPTEGGRAPSAGPSQASPAGAGEARQHLNRDVDAPEASARDEQLPFDYYFLNHTSFLRRERQEDFRRRTGVPLDHFDIRVIVDSYYKGALDRIERVEYLLHSSYPEPLRVRTARDRPSKFLLKELANGEYVLVAEVFLKDRSQPVVLQRYITLSEDGPRLRV